MKSRILILLTSLLSLTTNNTYAADEDKHLQIGIGTYALTVAYDEDNFADDDFSGTAFSLVYASTDQLAFRGAFYSVEHDDFSALEADGFDLSLVVGVGLLNQGFKIYGGGGIFNETWDLGGAEEDFSGLQITGGIGYNWNNVALDFVLSIRDPSDYENFIEDIFPIDVDPAVVTGSLMVSIRF